MAVASALKIELPSGSLFDRFRVVFPSWKRRLITAAAPTFSLILEPSVPELETSSSSHSSAQSTLQRPVWPASDADPPPAVTQPTPQGVLPHATPELHPSLGRGLLTLRSFLPLPPVERGAQLLAALNRSRSAAVTGARQPTPTISPSQQGTMTTTTRSAGASTVPLPHLRLPQDWVRPRLGSSSSTQQVLPRNPQRPQLFRVWVHLCTKNNAGRPPTPRPRSSLTERLYKVNLWEGLLQDRVCPHPVAPRERVRPLPRPGWPKPPVRSLPLPNRSL